MPPTQPGRPRGRLVFAGRSYRTALVLIAAAAAIGIFVYVVRQHEPLPNASNRRGVNGGTPVAVAVATANSGDIVLRVPALGTVTPLATVTVKTQISGQLQQIAFKEGQLVHKGDFLAQIDPRPYQSALEQVTANLQRDEALLANARVDVERYQNLVAQGLVAEQQVATQKALVAQYEGTVAGDRAQVVTARLNLQYTHIVSPIEGRVGLRQVDQGNYVTPGDANGIVVITQLQPITAVFSIPEDNIVEVMQRSRAGQPLPVTALDRGNSTALANGKLLAVDNQIDASTGTFKMRALFDNEQGLLFPNQFVNIQLLLDTLHGQITVPNAAIYRGAPNGVASAFVYRVEPDRTVAVQPVTLGAVDGDRVAIAKGLSAGDVVVTEGGDRLRQGASVVLPSDQPSHGHVLNGESTRPRKKNHSGA